LSSYLAFESAFKFLKKKFAESIADIVPPEVLVKRSEYIGKPNLDQEIWQCGVYD
jgi:hypothetical protein